MTPPTLYRTTHPDVRDPMKAAAWGARPRTVSPAVLLGDRLNSRRPAPICMGRSDGPGLELGGPTPVGQPRGYATVPLSPALPSRALACASRV